MESNETRDEEGPSKRRRALSWAAPFTAAFLVSCGALPDDAGEHIDTTEDVTNEGDVALNAPPEDGLKDAFRTFIDGFGSSNLDAEFRIGFGHHPGLNTETVRGPTGALARGSALLNLNTGNVQAFLENVPADAKFDLWLVKNRPGGTVAPEANDPMLKVGTFRSGEREGAFQLLDVSLGMDVLFDLDLVVVTRAGKKPNKSVVAIGDRTLFEKRLFRFRMGKGLDPVKGPLADDIETQDPLVARGAQLFFNETFGGNGRTCGTCHRAENNLTIDPAFIATLPQSDPLFVAENNRALAKLENPQLLRSRGLILENVDGFEDPENEFVMRSVNHTFSLGLTNGIQNVFSGAPDHRLGWGGDGGPGRSTLHDFTFGAIMQHFTKTLARRPGVDFRIPTEEELDALEAFQLFTGRQTPSDFFSRLPTDERAQNGANLFFSVGCTFCHQDFFAFPDFNANFDTGVRNLTPDLPGDDGFGSPGDGTFNVPPLAEAADTGPFFHNNAVDTIEEAVGFYFSPTFRASPSGFFVFGDLSTEEQGDIAAFLRVVNSFTNIDQVRKRIEYVRNVRSPGNTNLLTIALADTRDALEVLSEKGLSPSAQEHLGKAREVLVKAKVARDRNRPAAMIEALGWLDQASEELFTTPPDPGSGGVGGGTGGSAGKGGFPGEGGVGGVGEGGDDGGGFPAGGKDPGMGAGGAFPAAGRGGAGGRGGM